MAAHPAEQLAEKLLRGKAAQWEIAVSEERANSEAPHCVQKTASEKALGGKGIPERKGDQEGENHKGHTGYPKRKKDCREIERNIRVLKETRVPLA